MRRRKFTASDQNCELLSLGVDRKMTAAEIDTVQRIVSKTLPSLSYSSDSWLSRPCSNDSDLAQLGSIFVSIASYRDPEMQWTIRSLFCQAFRWDRLHCGVCFQYDPDNDQHCLIYMNFDNLRFI